MIRELSEELQIKIASSDFELFGTFFAQAAYEPDKKLQMDVFLVKQYQGEINQANEIDEILWINSVIPEGIKVGSIFEHEVIPKLKELNLIQ